MFYPNLHCGYQECNELGITSASQSLCKQETAARSWSLTFNPDSLMWVSKHESLIDFNLKGRERKRVRARENAPDLLSAYSHLGTPAAPGTGSGWSQKAKSKNQKAGAKSQEICVGF